MSFVNAELSKKLLKKHGDSVFPLLSVRLLEKKGQSFYVFDSGEDFVFSVWSNIPLFKSIPKLLDSLLDSQSSVGVKLDIRRPYFTIVPLGDEAAWSSPSEGFWTCDPGEESVTEEDFFGTLVVSSSDEMTQETSKTKKKATKSQ